MNTPMIQRLLAQNSDLITALHDYINQEIETAKFWKAKGERAFANDNYKEADKWRGKLAKAVKTQRELKDELNYNTSVQRSVANEVFLGADDYQEIYA